MNSDLDTFIHFVGQQAIRGKLSRNTAQSYATSIGRVFESATESEKANVLAVDVEKLFERFRRANADLGSNTIASYEGRVSAAIQSFQKAYGSPTEKAPKSLASGPLVIPLRSGAVRIEGLPDDLTEVEARKIAGVISAMATS
jgi:hypothetical protein